MNENGWKNRPRKNVSQRKKHPSDEMVIRQFENEENYCIVDFNIICS